MDKVIAKQRKVSIALAAVASLAATIVLSCVLYFISIDNDPALASLRFSPSSHYELSQSHALSADAPPSLQKGSVLTLSQGAVELNIDSGVKAIILAPAKLRLKEESHLELKRGTAWFHVPKGAEGFTVTTDDLDIIDLGTTFGVLAKSNGTDEVHVFEGLVEVKPSYQTTPPIRLKANQARGLNDNDSLATITLSPESFLTTLPDSLPYIHWSFDTAEDGALHAAGTLQTSNSVSTSLSGNAKPSLSSTGKFGEALKISPETHLQSTYPGISGNSPRTISYWIKASSGHSYLQPIVGWGRQNGATDRDGRIFYSLLRTFQDKTVSGISVGRYWWRGHTDLADGQWHHVAYTYHTHHSDNPYHGFTCYIDGVLEPMSLQPDDREISDFKFKTASNLRGENALWILKDLKDVRNSNEPILYPQSPRPEIDELYIFQGALPKEDILQLYLSNQLSQL